jgi:hypothetical protein
MVIRVFPLVPVIMPVALAGVNIVCASGGLRENREPDFSLISLLGFLSR